MPTKYRIQLDDGRKFDVEWDGPSPPTPEDIESSLPPVGDSGVTEGGPSLFGRTLDVMGRVGGVLGRPGAATAAVVKEGLEGYQQQQPFGQMIGEMLGGVKDTLTPSGEGFGKFKRTTDFDEVLGQAGMDEGWTRAGLGFVGDVVIDPINLIPGAAIAKAAGKAGKGVKTALSAVPVPGPVNRLGNAIGDTFVQYRGMDKFKGQRTPDLTFRDDIRLHESALRAADEQADAVTRQLFKDVNKADATKMLHEIDTTGRSTTLPAHGRAWGHIMDEAFQKKVDTRLVDKGAKIENYVPYMTKPQTERGAVVGSALKGFSQSDMPRTQFKTLKDAVAFGNATENAPELMAKYLSSNERAIANNEFLWHVANEYGSTAAKTGFRKANISGLSDFTKQALQDVHFPEEIASHLEKAVKVWETPVEMDRLYKTGVKLWKAMATSLNPGHHFTNFLGNIHNMYVGSDMTMPQITKGIVEAWTITKPGFRTDAGLRHIPRIGRYSGEQIRNAMMKYEIVGTANQLGEFTDLSTSQKLVNNPVLRFARRKGQEVVEDPSKIALFLHQLRKGDSIEQAALKVKDVLFDYSEVTKAEKGLRDTGIVPFYTWMRKNIPLQMRAVFEQPQKVERVKDLVNVPWNANETMVESTIIPEDRQKSGFVPGYIKTAEGVPVMQRFALPAADLNRLDSPESIADLLGPVPKFVMELASGQRLGGGRVRKASGWARPAPMANVLSPLNYLLPESMEGYITPAEVQGRSMQRDIPSWLMSFLPAGFLGSTMAGSDPMQPTMPPITAAGARFFGLTPDPITPEDQQFEARDRVAEWKRKYMQKVLEP